MGMGVKTKIFKFMNLDIARVTHGWHFCHFYHGHYPDVFQTTKVLHYLVIPSSG